MPWLKATGSTSSAAQSKTLTWAEYQAGVAAGTITDTDGIDYYITDKNYSVQASSVEFTETDNTVTNVQDKVSSLNSNLTDNSTLETTSKNTWEAINEVNGKIKEIKTGSVTGTSSAQGNISTDLNPSNILILGAWTINSSYSVLTRTGISSSTGNWVFHIENQAGSVLQITATVTYAYIELA